jgi:hypothetical protein
MDINFPVTQQRYQRHLPGITQAPSISRTCRSGTPDNIGLDGVTHYRLMHHLTFDAS